MNNPESCRARMKVGAETADLATTDESLGRSEDPRSFARPVSNSRPVQLRLDPRLTLEAETSLLDAPAVCRLAP